MNVASNVTSVTTQVSGATVIGSALSSKTAEYVASSAPTPEVVERATSVMITSDQLALASFIIMAVSAIWNIYSGRRRDKRRNENDERALELKERELMLREREMSLREKEKTDD